MAGLRPGQRGARVHYTGNSGKFQLNGSASKYQELWELLDSLHDAQGGAIQYLYQKLIAEKQSTLAADIREIKGMLADVLERGIQPETVERLESTLSTLDCKEFME
jgi:hypothetical protein